MKKALLFFSALFSLVLACNAFNRNNPNDISGLSNTGNKLTNADLDTVFNKGSGITTINLDEDRIKVLANLGMLWGFIKYHHPAVANGEFNMDAELFRVLAKIIKTKNTDEANKLMERWIDHFGLPDKCVRCSEIKRTDKTKLMPDYGYIFKKGNFPESLITKLEYIRDNRNNTGHNYYVEVEKAGGADFRHEFVYPYSFPDAGIRLLALYRFWNMVQYFYPNRHLIGEDWNNVLVEFIPKFINATGIPIDSLPATLKPGDTRSYELTCLQLIARIHDTHSQVFGNPAIKMVKGNYMPSFQAKFIENKLIVTQCYNSVTGKLDNHRDLNGLRVNDIIDAIDSVPVPDLIKNYAPFISASNYETLLRDVPSWVLRRRKAEQIVLTINRDGNIINMTAPCLFNADTVLNWYHLGQKHSAYKIINKNIGYIYPGTLNDTDLDEIKKMFKKTKGIVIDFRCYPHAWMTFDYGEWLKPWPSSFVKVSGISINDPGSFQIIGEESNGALFRSYYKGKVVIIVNSKTQSSAEFQTMALSSVPGAIVIGSTTAGADGNVTAITLPWNIKTYFSGIGIYYPDGSETQRVGIKIDKIIRPTIKETKEGRDEMLEEAISIINNNNKQK